MKKKMFYALSALLLCSACTTTPRNPFEEPARPAGQESVLKLACEPLDTVRVGFNFMVLAGMLFSAIFAVIFIVMYALNLKYMR